MKNGSPGEMERGGGGGGWKSRPMRRGAEGGTPGGRKAQTEE